MGIAFRVYEVSQRLDRPMLPRIASSIAIIVIAVFGCAERSPQQQMIPAVMDGDIAKVEALLNDTDHVDVNWRAGGDSTSALMTAADFDQAKVAVLLLQRGADPNLTTAEGWSPLLSAAYYGHADMVRLLLGAGARPNTAETRYGYSPLTIAASKGHTEVVRLLLDAGADRSVKARNGRDAADMARDHGHMETLEVLNSYQPSPGG